MADDRPQLDFDIDTDEGLEAYVLDLARRKGIPERLRYPETPEAYAAMIAEAEVDLERGEGYTIEEVRAHFADRFAALRMLQSDRRG